MTIIDQTRIEYEIPRIATDPQTRFNKPPSYDLKKRVNDLLSRCDGTAELSCDRYVNSEWGGSKRWSWTVESFFPCLHEQSMPISGVLVHDEQQKPPRTNVQRSVSWHAYVVHDASDLLFFRWNSKQQRSGSWSPGQQVGAIWYANPYGDLRRINGPIKQMMFLRIKIVHTS